MAKADVLRQAIDEAGYDGSNILRQANEPKYKAELRARTQEAKDIGICGVPSYRVFRKGGGGAWKQQGDIVWGQDLIGDVEDYIAGWEVESDARGTASRL